MKTESSKMQIRRYVADDMRQALKQIREELGPDAVILSNKRIPGGVEILTSPEYDPDALQQVRTERPKAEAVQANRAGALEREPAGNKLDSTFEQMLNQHLQPSAGGSVDEELMAAMRSEIENLRLLLKGQMEQMSRENWGAKNPIEAAVLQRFSDHGVSPQVAQAIADRVAKHATIEEGWQAALKLFGKQIPIADAQRFNQGVVALLGPTGAGKTTTIAKLAVRYALRHSRDELALVTTDRYRLAAYEQLKALGRIIDVPVRLVDEQTSLSRVLRSLRDKSLVLIDTAGFPASDTERLQQLDELDSTGTAIQKLLVLPCTSQNSALHSAYDLVKKADVDACVLSKTDEIMSFGEVLSLVVEKALPVAYITNGQSIPDDIEPAGAANLMRLLCGDEGRTELEIPEIVNRVRPRARSGVYAGR